MNGHSYGLVQCSPIGTSGKVAREHAQLAGDQLRQAGLQRLGRVRDVLADEEVRQVRVGALAVEVHQLGARDVEPARAQHVELDRDVREVLVFDLVEDFTSIRRYPLPSRSRMSTAA